MPVANKYEIHEELRHVVIILNRQEGVSHLNIV